MQDYTTIEQSKELLGLGLGTETANMTWLLVPRTDNTGYTYNSVPTAIPYSQYTAKECYIPCWSLGALLEIMPKDIKVENTIYCQIQDRGSDGSYSYIYKNPLKDANELGYWLWVTNADTSLKAAYEMVAWLLENNHIKKGE